MCFYSLDFTDVVFFRYLEELESKLRGQQKLQARINELEARLREIDSSGQYLSSARKFSHNLSPAESSVVQLHPQPYISPNMDFPRSNTTSPQYSSYPDDRFLDSTANHDALSSGGDVDPDTNPGVFEAGEAGKGWYLGCASGSKATYLQKLLIAQWFT